jgi:hypothetical protein
MARGVREGERMIQPALVAAARVDDERITFALVDGRELSLPTARSRRLASASPAERASFRVIGGGTVVEWPLVDEHIGV